MPASFGYSACVYPYIKALFLTDIHPHMPHKYYLSTYLNRQVLVENNNELIKEHLQRIEIPSIGSTGENTICSNNLHRSSNYHL